jgi:hypothetical protein
MHFKTRRNLAVLPGFSLFLPCFIAFLPGKTAVFSGFFTAYAGRFCATLLDFQKKFCYNKYVIKIESCEP